MRDRDIEKFMREMENDTNSEPAPVSARQKEAAANARPKSILESFEHIVELAEKSNLDEEFFAKASRQIKYASRKLKLTPMQTALLSIFIDKSEDNHITATDIARYTGCRTTKILRLNNEIDVLVDKNYLKASRGRRGTSYRVPQDVLKALRQNQPYVYVPEPVTDTREFFDRFNRLMSEMSDHEQTHESLIRITFEMLNEIHSSEFATKLRGSYLDNEDTLLFIYMAHLFVENRDDNILFSDIENIFDNDELPHWLKNEFRSRESDLFGKELIENVNEDGMARSDAFKLTDKAKEEFLCELNLNSVGKSEKGLIQADSLAAKTLIYNDAEKTQIGELSSILSEKRFSEVQERLRSAGMRPGFCCLFYGSPGTGKTETVYQIARQTGRNIMQVDVDKIKSCWVGESEKNIKALFTRYRNICKASKLAPILLFNEADAVLGVRMEGAARAVDKMENSIQNIILQEMESLDGIMIATTNLTTNLDKAFERRFLYKIKFERPTTEARAKIWQGMIGGLTESDALTLAGQFDLSGGEIENIARKHSVNAILSGKEDIDLAELADICAHERISQSRPRMGF